MSNLLICQSNAAAAAAAATAATAATAAAMAQWVETVGNRGVHFMDRNHFPICICSGVSKRTNEHS